MRLIGGAETSKGRVRELNQDRPVLNPWVAGVADGMGGHQAGETAAQLAASQLAAVQGPLRAEELVSLVQAANEQILEAGQDPDLRGMGTTLVALTLMDDEVLIANVGDSRAYRLAGTELEQLTEDHSLVEDLVRMGQLTPEEARTHPQRNIVTRALGTGLDIEVDVFHRPARVGDRYLLCSDGLFNEVEVERIAVELRRWEDPGEAARELVRLANEAGARDNVTCVVVDVTDDEPAGAAPGGATAAGVAAPAAEPPTGVRSRSGAGAALDEEDPDASRRTRRGRERSGRRFPWRAVPYLVAVLAIVGVAVGGTIWWDRSGYFVAEVDGRVAILQGRPGGVLWMEPRVHEPTDLVYDELTGASQQRLADPPVSSLERARQLVDGLEVEAPPPPAADAPDAGAAGDPGADGATSPDDRAGGDASADPEEPDGAGATAPGPTPAGRAATGAGR